MSGKRVRFGILGLGRHGARYAEHLTRNDVPNAELVAVFRRDAEKGRAFAEQNACRFYGDPDALIADPDVDAVIITTPPNVHAPLTVAAAKAGKHILCEKPMARSVAECVQMRDAAHAAGVKLTLGQTMRYTPMFAVLKERMGDIGTLHGFHVCMRQEKSPLEWHLNREISGGGVVTEIGVHAFDAMRHVSGRKTVRVMATAMDTHEAGIETYVSALMWLEGGAVSLLDLAKCVDSRLFRMDAVGSDGQLIANVTSTTLEWVKGRAVTSLPAPANIPTIAPLLSDFCESILCDAPLRITPDEGIYTLAVCEAFYRSIETGVPADVSG